MDGAGSALSDSAAELRARELQVIPENPEQGSIRRHIRLVVFAVHMKRNHSLLLSFIFLALCL
jgi:hypothetical protein